MQISMMSQVKNIYGQYDVPVVENCINLKVGQPSPHMLPLHLFTEAWRNMATKVDNPFCLQYGKKAGYERFREKLARFVTENIADAIPDQLFVTTGVTGAVCLLFKLLTKKATEVNLIMEDPSYFIM